MKIGNIMNKKLLVVALFFLIAVNTVIAKAVVYDTEGVNLKTFFAARNCKYILNYSHIFNNEIVIPENCEIEFQKGALKGPIKFNNTKLSGNVRLQGAVISGSLFNKVFYAKWMCFADGIHDDADNINQILNVSDKVIFTNGCYRLTSLHTPSKEFDSKLWKYPFHIGINKSNVFFKGKGDNVIFLTNEIAGIICIYSLPNSRKNTVNNIRIENIIFKTNNDGINFNEFLHSIKTIGVKRLVVKGCSFFDFWGDAICLSTYGDTRLTGERTRNSRVKIVNNLIIGNTYYNTGCGISVVNGKNILIDKNTISRVSRKHMPGAIDVEANNVAYTIDNIKIVNNIIFDCQGTGGGIVVNANQNGAPAHNIVIKNNRISRCSNGLAFVVRSDNTSSNYRVIGNTIDSCTNPFLFIGESKTSNWVFKDNTFKQTTIQIPGNISVRNLIIKDNKYINKERE